MKKIIIFAVIILVFVAGLYFLWQKRHEYFFQGELENLKEDSETIKKNDNRLESDNADDPEFDDAEIGADEDDEEDGDGDEEEDLNDDVSDEILKESYQEILETDCGNRCEDKKDTDDHAYCLEICGLRDGDEDTSNCESLSGLSKDACFKSKAVEEKNYKYCSEIEDDNLRESCKDRVLEEIID